ncbi:CHAT domain-containing protein [Actinocrispum wychmicini]|uniref:CHAT domain-containing protein n=1 Tax=Actinocrispum wychmicini TaxID=1213861 RepID=A0A4R2JJS1_9PSEU|nr:CHAT domain-containing protein [Actinocrispum wychmicini]TCO59384.1 CHAT domain-containing protein [Actinocrispum wychmicini]
MAVQWGDVAGWLQGLGSLFALGFAAAAVVVTRRTYRIESERDRVNAEAREVQAAFTRRAQAALVSAWWGPDHTGTRGAFVRNASETPVYQVYLTVVGADDRTDGHKTHYLVVPPGEVLFAPIDSEAGAPAARRVKLSFTDAAGVRWLRNQYGRLTELQPTLCITADPPRAKVFSRFQGDFLATYGVNVEFHTNAPGYSQRRFVADLERTAGIDALICPHDWLGDLISRKLIEPTVLSAEHHNAFPSWALSALTVDSHLYGLLTDLGPAAGVMLHLACHGSFATGLDDAKSYLLLAPADQRASGAGELTAEEILDLLATTEQCQVSLVVLAACNTGRSVHGYDEAYSLGTAFLAGGTRSVLSTQWSIPDLQTPALMYLFHHYCRTEGRPPWQALRQAQMWMLDPLRQAPERMPTELLRSVPAGEPAPVVAWAGFIHYGL